MQQSSDLANVAGIAPLAIFFLIAIIVYAFLTKTKIIGEGKFIKIIASFLVAVLFVPTKIVRDIYSPQIAASLLLITVSIFMMWLFLKK